MATYNATATITETTTVEQDRTVYYYLDVVSDDYRIESGWYGVAVSDGETVPLDSDGVPVDYNDWMAQAILDLFSEARD